MSITYCDPIAESRLQRVFARFQEPASKVSCAEFNTDSKHFVSAENRADPAVWKPFQMAEQYSKLVSLYLDYLSDNRSADVPVVPSAVPTWVRNPCPRNAEMRRWLRKIARAGAALVLDSHLGGPCTQMNAKESTFVLRRPYVQLLMPRALFAHVWMGLQLTSDFLVSVTPTLDMVCGRQPSDDNEDQEECPRGTIVHNTYKRVAWKWSENCYVFNEPSSGIFDKFQAMFANVLQPQLLRAMQKDLIFVEIVDANWEHTLTAGESYLFQVLHRWLSQARKVLTQESALVEQEVTPAIWTLASSARTRCRYQLLPSQAILHQGISFQAPPKSEAPQTTSGTAAAAISLPTKRFKQATNLDHLTRLYVEFLEGKIAMVPTMAEIQPDLTISKLPSLNRRGYWTTGWQNGVAYQYPDTLDTRQQRAYIQGYMPLGLFQHMFPRLMMENGLMVFWNPLNKCNESVVQWLKQGHYVSCLPVTIEYQSANREYSCYSCDPRWCESWQQFEQFWKPWLNRDLLRSLSKTLVRVTCIDMTWGRSLDHLCQVLFDTLEETWEIIRLQFKKQ